MVNLHIFIFISIVIFIMIELECQATYLAQLTRLKNLEPRVFSSSS